jgi:hypothetical protein
MDKIRILGWSAGLAACAILAAWAWPSRAPGHVTTPPAAKRLEVDIPVAEIAAPQPSAPARHAPPPASSTDRARPPSPAVDVRAEVVEREIGRRVEQLDFAHRNEVREPGWAQRAETLLLEVAASPDFPETQAVRTECRRTLCVAEYSTSSRDEFTRIPELADIGGTSGYFVEVPSPTGDGRRHLLLYLARAGHSLPRTN